MRAESRGLTARQVFERVAAETGRPVDAVESAYEHVAASGTEGEGARLIRAFRDAEEALRAYVDGLENDRQRLDAIRAVAPLGAPAPAPPAPERGESVTDEV